MPRLALPSAGRQTAAVLVMIPRAVLGRLFSFSSCLNGLWLLACTGNIDSNTAGPHLDQVPAWALLEELRIGSMIDPDEGFSIIRGIQVFEDGRFVVAEGRDRQLRVYDAEGRLLARFGRQGQGPGEFESLSAFGVAGDTVWIQDSASRRVTLFTADGVLLNTVSGEGIEVMEGSSWVRIAPRRVTPDGVIVGAPVQWVFEDSMRVPVVRFSLSGAPLDTLGWRWLRLPEHNDGLGARSAVDAGGLILYLRERSFPSGSVRFRVGEAEVAVEQIHTSDAPGIPMLRIVLLDSRGAAVLAETYRYDPIALPELLAVQAYDDLTESAIQRGATRGAAEAAIRRHVQTPEFLFPVTEALSTEEGGLWLRREDAGSLLVRWTILDAGGHPRGEVLIPNTVTPYVVRADVVWSIDHDEFGVPYVVRYRLVHSRGD